MGVSFNPLRSDFADSFCRQDDGCGFGSAVDGAQEFRGFGGESIGQQGIGQQLLQTGQGVIGLGQELIGCGDVRDGIQLIRDGAGLEEQGAGVEGQDCGGGGQQIGQASQPLVSSGQQLIALGERLIREGAVQQGMQLVREGSRLEEQGAKSEQSAAPLNPFVDTSGDNGGDGAGPAGGGGPAAAGSAGGSSGGPAAAGTAGGSGGGARAAQIAQSYLGQTSSALKLDSSDSLDMDPSCPSGESCANFVSGVLIQAGLLPASQHTDSVAQLQSTLQGNGWTEVPMSQAQPGDVVIMQGGGISHTEMIASNGEMIGSNNTSSDSQTVSYNQLSYAESHGGVVLRPPGSTASSGSAGSSGAGGGGQPLASGENARAKQIYDYLVSQYHFTPAQAAGIVGNMEVESSLNPSAQNSAEGAIGLSQWEGGRRTDLENFAAAHGESATNWKTQVDFMVHELQTDESGAYGALKSATTATQAATVFDEDYERSAGTTRSQRIADADNVAAEFG